MIPLSYFLVVGAVLFALGLIGVVTRRNLIVLFLCSEMMLQGVALNFVAFSRFHANLQGQVFTLLIITVAACEAALALALILVLYRTRKTLDVSVWQDLRELGQEPAFDDEPLPPPPAPPEMPRLPVAGPEPAEPREDYSRV